MPDLDAPLTRPLRDLSAWTEHFRRADVPVLAQTAEAIEAMRENEDDVDANAIGEMVSNDPLMTLKVLAYAATHRPVRVITNTSSGKMGYAIAQAAADAGATVCLVSGPTALATPAGVTRIDVKTARDMFAAVKEQVGGAEVFIAVAAVADYYVKEYSERKLKKNEHHPGLTLELAENPDILKWVAGLPQPPFCVGFAAESHDVLENAEDKRRRKGIPLLVANRAQDAFGRDDNEVTLIDDRGRHPLPRGSKSDLARDIIAHLAEMLDPA